MIELGRGNRTGTAGEHRVQALARAATDDRGAGSVLVLGVVASCVTVSLLVIPIYRGAVTKRTVANAADAAALAAADVATGIVPGVPCDAASTAAALNGARLSECRLSGVVATVATESFVLGVRVEARARAGPPGFPGERYPGLDAASAPGFRDAETTTGIVRTMRHTVGTTVYGVPVSE
ncbi:Rv3654c family TadE-like protein [Planctomonas deserti]|uniref:Rv3654c family TadE-like protein n=1 Tax=Planctomonas deserti TaxID=2144185 RepID=UPI00131EF061|nr:Rv3654c family TadE-like protein [Planctomonas deserti]